MNVNGLPRLYDRLSVWERIPLLIAAGARGDDREYRRLFDTSALRTCRFSEHLLAEQGLHALALTYVCEQLDAAANYFFAKWAMAYADDAPLEDWLLAADAYAYFFTINSDAWRRFCTELDIAPDVLTAANHSGWFLPYCEERMPAHAPTADALQARFRTVGRDIPNLVTADDLLASWRNALRAMTGSTARGTRVRV